MKKDSLTSRNVLAAEHGRIREKIHSFDMIAEELEVMDQTRIAGEWVEAKVDKTKEALVELERLLSSLHARMIAHWHREGKELIPFFRETVQKNFAANLVHEHRQMGIGISRFHHKTEELVASKMGAEQLSAEVHALKNDLAYLFEKLEGHANREEQMLFQLGHEV